MIYILTKKCKKHVFSAHISSFHHQIKHIFLYKQFIRVFKLCPTWAPIFLLQKNSFYSMYNKFYLPSLYYKASKLCLKLNFCNKLFWFNSETH